MQPFRKETLKINNITYEALHFKDREILDVEIFQRDKLKYKK